MILGHYAAAYLVRPHQRQSPLWLLLLCANLPEFLWLLLALQGIESPEPASLLDATFASLQVSMTYSHNLVPNLLLSLAVFLAIRIWKKDLSLALACAFLCASHVWLDYLVGFEHQLTGEHSASIGLNSYHRFPHLAILIELAFAWLCLFYYSWQSARKGQVRRELRALFVAFSLGILAWLPVASTPLRQFIGL
ncbi:MAG: hypothetical protein HS115_10875 [Spirochaetales bacterium]|nr:hypothetical protein [Spirochaetales bacterium]